MPVLLPNAQKDIFMNRYPRSIAKSAITLAVMCSLIVDGSPALAVTRFWNGGSGNFSNADNWSPTGAPTVSDVVSFEVGSGLAYTVTFPGNQLFDLVASYTTSHLRVRRDAVTFAGSSQGNLGSATYTVASTTQAEVGRGIIIGELAGDAPVLTMSAGGFVGSIISSSPAWRPRSATPPAPTAR